MRRLIIGYVLVFLFAFNLHLLATQKVVDELEVGAEDECQNFTEVLEDPEGTLVCPPNRDVLYRANCEWSLTISTGNENDKLALDFESFSLSYGDNLTITDIQFGGTYNELFWHANKPPSDRIRGLQDIILITFTSDEIHESTGFVFSWFIDTPDLETTTNNGLPADTAFRSVLPGSNGKLISPNYPGDYPLSKNLYWVLTAPEGETVQVRFQDFLLAFDDSLAFYEGIVKSSETQRAKYTGAKTSLPSPVRSLSNKLLVVFVSTQFVSERGFSLTYSIYVPAPPATTTEEASAKKAVRPMTAEGKTVLIVLGLLVVLVVSIICVYLLYWRPKQMKEEQRIASELYPNDREPISMEKVPQRPVSAAQIARIRAAAHMKSDYGFGPNKTMMQFPALERPVTSSQHPGGPQATPATRQAQGITNTAADIEDSAGETGWSTKLEERSTPKRSTVLRAKHQQPEQSLAAKVQAAAMATAAPAPAAEPVVQEAPKRDSRNDPLPPLFPKVTEEKVKKKKKASKSKPAAAEAPEPSTATTPRPNSARSGSGLKHSSTAPGGLASSKLPGYVLAANDEEDCV